MIPKFKILYTCLVLSILSVQVYAKEWALNECIERAWQMNVQLHLIISNNEFNNLNEYQAKWNLFPTLNASANQGLNWGRSLDPVSYQYTNQFSHTNNFSLSSNTVLFAGFQYRNTIKKYNLDKQAGQAAIDAEKYTIALNVAGAYLQILLAQEQLGVTRNQLAASQTDVDRTKLLVNLGKVAEANLMQLQSQLATFKSQVIDAENLVILSKLSLEQLMELPISSDFSVITPVLSNELTPIDTSKLTDEIYKVALTTQPQIKQSDLQVQSANMNLDVSKGAYLPKLSLGANLNSGYSSSRSNINYQTEVEQRNLGLVNGNPAQVVSGPVITQVPVASNYPFSNQLSDNVGQSLLLTLGIPIFNNMQARTNVLRAKATIVQVQLNQQLTKNELRKSVEQAFTDLRAANKKYAASEEAVNYSLESNKNIEERFKEGLSTTSDLFISKSTLLQAQSQLIQAKYDYIFKQKVLDFYLGKPISL